MCRKYVKVGVNDLASQYPEIAKQAYGWDPKTVSKGSGKTCDWFCNKCKGVYSAKVKDRIYHNNGCPYCAGKQVLVGYNDLQTTHPEVAKQAYGWDPKTVSRGMKVEKDWFCIKCNGVYSATVAYKTYDNTGCPYCSGNKVLVGYNDLQTTHSKVAKQAYGWDPRTVSKGCFDKYNWLCEKCNGVYSAKVNDRTNSRGCPYCAGQQVLVGYNDLTTTHPKIAKQAYGWDPKTVTKGYGDKCDWLCGKCNGVYSATVANRTTNNSGCPYCCEKGFNAQKPAYLYFLKRMVNKQLQHKIGICNDDEKRISVHKSKGWQVVDKIHYKRGKAAKDLETKIKDCLANMNIKTLKCLGEEKFDGYTECWKAKQLTASSIKHLLKILDI